MERLTNDDLRRACQPKYRRGFYGELIYIDPAIEAYYYMDEFEKAWGEEIANDLFDEAQRREKCRLRRGLPRLPEPVYDDPEARMEPLHQDGATDKYFAERDGEQPRQLPDPLPARAEDQRADAREVQAQQLEPEPQRQPGPLLASQPQAEPEAGPPQRAEERPEIGLAQRAGATQSPSIIARCARCYRSGHLAARCPREDNRICGWCFEIGHIERDCDNPDAPELSEEEARLKKGKNEDILLARISRKEASFEDLTNARRRLYKRV